MKPAKPLPLVYSCSGCSSAAQMANYVAIKLDRSGLAEMSCIAGVGGDVPTLVRVAQSGRPIIALDGCKLHCVRNCLRRHGMEPTVHHTLTDYGIKKRLHLDFDENEAQGMLNRISASLERREVSCTGSEADSAQGARSSAITG